MIKVFLGPMKSGKSANLIYVYEQCKHGKDVIAIKPKLDTRDKNIKSRNGKSINAITLSNFKEIYELMKENFSINNKITYIIDEVQFFDSYGMLEFVKFAKTHQIHVYIAGLNLTSEMTPFKTTMEICMYADEIQFIKGVCDCCNEKSELTKCIVEKNDEVLIGDEIYISTCYNCY